MDDIDRAQEREELDRELALAALARRLEAAAAVTPRSDCEACDEPLEPARLAAHPGATRCVPCQQQWEIYGV